MRDDFAALILTHGRPNNVKTFNVLKRDGYTGKIYLVVDDEDPTLAQYQDKYGDKVLVFSKIDIEKTFDVGDNFDERRAVIWARNASFDLARSVGCRYFVQLDDDYYDFQVRGERGLEIQNLDTIFEAMVNFLSIDHITTVAIAQGGDHIGGFDGCVRLKRKAMNSFFCDVEKPFRFVGRINEDVNTYVSLGHRGWLFFTMMNLQLDQSDTQSSAGGMSEAYQDQGTYAKSFYSVMFAPSCVTIRSMGVHHPRLHHRIDWNAAVPCILAERHKFQ